METKLKDKPSTQKKMVKKQPTKKEATGIRLPKTDASLNLNHGAKLINKPKKNTKKAKVINSPAILENDKVIANQSNFVVSDPADPTKVYTVILNNGQIPCLTTNPQYNLDTATTVHDNSVPTKTVSFTSQGSSPFVETSEIKLEDIKIEIIRDANTIAMLTSNSSDVQATAKENDFVRDMKVLKDTYIKNRDKIRDNETLLRNVRQELEYIENSECDRNSILAKYRELLLLLRKVKSKSTWNREVSSNEVIGAFDETQEHPDISYLSNIVLRDEEFNFIDPTDLLFTPP